MRRRALPLDLIRFRLHPYPRRMADFGSRPPARAPWRSSGSAVAEPSAQSKHALAGRTILQIVPELRSGGAERATIEIAAALAAIGARPLVASFGGRLVSELQAKGGIWHPFPAKTKNPLAMLANQRRLVDLIHAEDVALVHARSRAPAWVAYWATRKTGTPFVTTFHGAYSGTSGLKKRYNSIMAKGDVVIANSSFTAERIARLYPSSRSKIRVIHRGVDLRAFSPDAVNPQRVQALRQAWGIAPGERIVLLAARLSPWKGHKILIEAARQLVSAGLADIKFILAGDEKTRGTYLKEVDAAIARRRPHRPCPAHRLLCRHAGGAFGGFGRRRSLDRARGLRQGRGGGAGHGDARLLSATSALCRKWCLRRPMWKPPRGPAGGSRQAMRAPWRRR